MFRKYVLGALLLVLLLILAACQQAEVVNNEPDASASEANQPDVATDEDEDSEAGTERDYYYDPSLAGQEINMEVYPRSMKHVLTP